jgi:hypothetical protein
MKLTIFLPLVRCYQFQIDIPKTRNLEAGVSVLLSEMRRVLMLAVILTFYFPSL